jgi:acyl carrier protein
LSDEEIFALIREVIAAYALAEQVEHVGEVDWDTRLTALGIDSIGLLEAAADLEGKLKIEFSLEQLVRVDCVRDLAALIRELRAATRDSADKGSA